MNTPDNLMKKPTQPGVWTSILSLIALLVIAAAAMAVGVLFIQVGSGMSPLQIVSELLALDSIHIWWYISRAAGLVGYLLIWLSTIWGFAVGSKIFDSVLERVFTFDFHEHLSLLGLEFVGLHAAVLLFDHVEPLSITEILIPFVSSYRPFWTGIGIFAFYLSVLVSVTFYIRSRISIKAFRAIHYLSIAAYAGALIHGLYAGSDSSLPWVQTMYWGTFLSTVFFGVYWLMTVRLRKGEEGNRQPINTM